MFEQERLETQTGQKVQGEKMQISSADQGKDW